MILSPQPLTCATRQRWRLRAADLHLWCAQPDCAEYAGAISRLPDSLEHLGLSFSAAGESHEAANLVLPVLPEGLCLRSLRLISGAGFALLVRRFAPVTDACALHPGLLPAAPPV